MPGLMIINVPPYSPIDQPPLELEFDAADLSNLDWKLVKEMSGVLPGTIDEAADAQDPTLMVALGACALRKHSQPLHLDRLWAGRPGDIFYLTEEYIPAYRSGGIDAVAEQIQGRESGTNPTTPTPSGSPSETPGESASSGDSSTPDGEEPAETP